jgi:hypothetical protein
MPRKSDTPRSRGQSISVKLDLRLYKALLGLAIKPHSVASLLDTAVERYLESRNALPPDDPSGPP